MCRAVREPIDVVMSMLLFPRFWTRISSTPLCPFLAATWRGERPAVFLSVRLAPW